MAVFKYLKGDVDKNKQEKNSNNNNKTLVRLFQKSSENGEELITGI